MKLLKKNTTFQEKKISIWARAYPRRSSLSLNIQVEADWKCASRHFKWKRDLHKTQITKAWFLLTVLRHRGQDILVNPGPSFYYHGAMTIVFQWTLRLYHLRNVSRLSPLFILRLFSEHSEIEHCYFLYQLVLIDMCIYIIYFTLFYFMPYRAPVDTSLVNEGVTLFKYQLLSLLLLLLLLLLSITNNCTPR